MRVLSGVMFFPTYGSYEPATDRWRIDLHAWAYEAVTDSPARRALSHMFRRALGLKREHTDCALYERRAAMFLVNTRKGANVIVRLGEQTHALGATQKNGHVKATLELDAAVVDRHVGEDRVLRLEPVDAQAPPTVAVRLLGPRGVSVISDIDDTIKASYVWKKRKLVKTTFTRRWKPTKGLPDLYQQWAEAGAAFHYVSTTPWQLYPALAQFVQRVEYPDGTFHLKRFRWKDRSFFDLFAEPLAYKLALIEPILLRFPHRRFILVGDSGECDPEAYGLLARRYPHQVGAVLIRDVTDRGPEHERYARAFEGLAPGCWQVVRKVKHLDGRWAEAPAWVEMSAGDGTSGGGGDEGS